MPTSTWPHGQSRRTPGVGPGSARASRPRAAFSLVAAGVLATALQGCVSAGTSSPSGSASQAAEESLTGAAALVPEEVRARGALSAATDATYPPFEYVDTDGTTLVGFNIDLGEAVAEQLQLDITVDNVKFDSILTGIVGGRYDLAVATMKDTAERREQVDFVDYMEAGTGILVEKGNPAGIDSLEDLCGQAVAIVSGTIQVDITARTPCPAGSEISITELPDAAASRQQIITDRVVATVEAYPVAVYTAATSNGGQDFEVVGEQVDSDLVGIAVDKSVPELTEAVQAAVQELKDDGTYDELLAKYDMEQVGIDEITINAG